MRNEHWAHFPSSWPTIAATTHLLSSSSPLPPSPALGQPAAAPWHKPTPASSPFSLSLTGVWDPTVRPVIYLGPMTRIQRCHLSGLALPPPPHHGGVMDTGMPSQDLLSTPPSPLPSSLSPSLLLPRHMAANPPHLTTVDEPELSRPHA